MTPHYADDWLTVYQGDAATVLRELPAESVHCVVTSPPYWGLRDYGMPGQLGMEPTPEAYVEAMVAVFREVWRVLRADGTLWLNMGDSYNANVGAGFNANARIGHQNTVRRWGKPKDLVGMPWRLAFALQADGWYLRSDIIWAKPNPMPESVTDRPTKSHEYLFLLTKSARYFYDAEAVRLPVSENWKPNGAPPVPEHGYHVLTEGRTGHQIQRVYDEAKGANARTVWTIATEPYPNVKLERALGQRDGDDGTDHKASPDCPVHGDQDQQAPTVERDGQSDASPAARNRRTDPHPAQGQLDALVPIGRQPAEDSVLGSSDWPDPVNEGTATPHSTGSRRTAHALGTSPHEIDDEKSSPHTGHIRPDVGSAASDGRVLANSTGAGSEADGRRSYLVERMPPRTTCTCTSWDNVSHFAVFPRKLVEPCIKAGTSERGVCPECGAPWLREVERGDLVRDDGSPAKLVDPIKRDGSLSAWSRPGGKVETVVPNSHRQSQTIGWKASCHCCLAPHLAEAPCADHYPPIPATVLDPFAGTGTVGLVAQSLSRRAILIDLSTDYMGQLLHRNRQTPLGLMG